MPSMAQININFIASEIIFFNVLGVFGNLNFIYLTTTRKKLQSKSSILQCCLSFCHVVCLLFELPNSYLLFSGNQLHRNVCFPAISIYIFFICSQAVLILMITIDIIVIVYFPSFYQTASTYKYIISMCIPPVIYSSVILVWGFLTMDDELIPFCNPPLSMTLTVRRIWTFSNVVINTMILLLFVFLIVIFYRRGKSQKSDTRKIMKRLKTMLLIFICTWYIALLAADLFVALGIRGDALNFMTSNLVFFVLICYSQSFYTVLWRSSEYRLAFLDAWSVIPCVSEIREKHFRSSRVGVTSTYGPSAVHTSNGGS